LAADKQQQLSDPVPTDGSTLSAGTNFSERHIGPRPQDVAHMLSAISASSVDQLVREILPAGIHLGRPLALPQGAREAETIETLSTLGKRNQIYRSFIGAGYYDCFTPAVIQRGILENPGWYTQYTPYQAEISQGRLEALLNFQQMVIDLSGLDVAGASLLDEATAAAEAMQMMAGVSKNKTADTFLVADDCHPQTLAVLQTRAKPRNIKIVVGDPEAFDFGPHTFGALIQYPGTYGTIRDPQAVVERAHAAGALVAVATDLLALTLLKPPGELGADVALGSAQRFGVPLGFGGPHAAFFATREAFTRKMPGRLIGVSLDSNGKTAYRMALQTREQHIRRDKATSNICTAQVLLAVIASMYAVYHGPSGLRAIAGRVTDLTARLRQGLTAAGLQVLPGPFFDTLSIDGSKEQVGAWHKSAHRAGLNFRQTSATRLGISLDETATSKDVEAILGVFGISAGSALRRSAQKSPEPAGAPPSGIPAELVRNSDYLTHPVFHSYHSEAEMTRYMKRLEGRDLSLTHAMIPLGSCTMKLNAAAEMMPITDPSWARLHPFVPQEQAQGYAALFSSLESSLSEITGFPAVSLQPNAGSQGEFAGLLVIRAYHESRNESGRTICLIPSSAHGTNPASAVMAGYRVVVVRCDDEGNVDLADLKAKAESSGDQLAALMVTYPSTHGIFEEDIQEICSIVHKQGGQVYMDGANLNAQVGLCRPADFGADVCHMNLHKTFCIPHGGGGPGMGPIGCAEHLAPFLPSHPLVDMGGASALGTISAAPWGSANILLISWAYINMMGGPGLTEATRVAILNANYIAERLRDHFPILYRGARGRVGHECIVDMRFLKKASGVEVEDVAKRLMDYGFHAPTMSFPIAGTMMIEPTESESLQELDRFCEAMIEIRKEIAEIENGDQPREDNLLKNAPHSAETLLVDTWEHPYPRARAAYPLPWVRANKFWPSVGRINNVKGDRQFICTCPPVEAFADPDGTENGPLSS